LLSKLKPQRAGNFDFLDSGDADNIGEGHTRVALRLRREESQTSFSECSTAVSRWVRRALRGRQRAIWASHKSFWRKDKGDSGSGGGKDFHGQERLLDTHQSKADPEALVTVARQITRRTVPWKGLTLHGRRASGDTDLRPCLHAHRPVVASEIAARPLGPVRISAAERRPTPGPRTPPRFSGWPQATA
jgi:hypothetical protein